MSIRRARSSSAKYRKGKDAKYAERVGTEEDEDDEPVGTKNDWVNIHKHSMGHLSVSFIRRPRAGKDLQRRTEKAMKAAFGQALSRKIS